MGVFFSTLNDFEYLFAKQTIIFPVPISVFTSTISDNYFSNPSSLEKMHDKNA